MCSRFALLFSGVMSGSEMMNNVSVLVIFKRLWLSCFWVEMSVH